MAGRGHMPEWAECVPNFSEGRDPSTLDRLERAAKGAGAALLDRHSDHDHHRSVLTLAASLDVIEAAIIAVAEVAVQTIDLTHHSGTHPRIGSLDVIPVVPLGRVSPQACVETAHSIGERLWGELGLPVYFYGRAAVHPDRVRLESIRRVGFERLARLTSDGDMRPDVGGPDLHRSAGACCVGVREPLVAFNVVLDGCDVTVANKVARAVRESTGGLPGVKALGMRLASVDRVQVSMNITKPAETPLDLVFDAVTQEAAKLGAGVLGSELVGLAPRAALGSDPSRLRITGFHQGMILEERLRSVRRTGRPARPGSL